MTSHKVHHTGWLSANPKDVVGCIMFKKLNNLVRAFILVLVITLRTKLSRALYCYRSCVCLHVCNRWAGGVCLWVCYHDNSKLCASILTKLCLWVKVVTISIWLNFDRPTPPGRGSAAGQKIWAPPYYSQRAVCVSLSAFCIVSFVQIIFIII